MAYMEDYLRRIEEVTLPRLRRQLEALESGATPNDERKAPGPLVGAAQKNALSLKQAIAEYEGIVAKLRAGEKP
ncbi:hypothetical protein [Methylocapsa acidiphila]|uniref:hypothetical protein n=1 Tax=Methylocapsa acidiphila TaxID=133552 RepID=UPI00040B050A|nr:hypothetical protein [Methylocapsa acidiphila]